MVGGKLVEYMPHGRGIPVTDAEYINHFSDITKVAFQSKGHGFTAEDTDEAMRQLREYWG